VPQETADVVVVGGGPAGAAAAITLARAGRDVMVIDKARFPRDKCCGDGLTAGALRLLESLRLDPSVIESWQPVDEVIVRSPSGHQATFPLPRGRGLFAAVARRVDFDAALLDVARVAGVKVFDGHALVDARDDGERIVLDVDGIGPVEARYAIGADGMWSPLRKALGASTPGYLGEWHAFRQYFSGVSTAGGRDLFVWFEPDLLPGYAWSFPLPGGRANVGFGIQRDGGKVARVQDMKDLWPALLERPHVRDVLGPDAQAEAPHKAWPIPARVDAAPLTAGRALFVGDAACATDPMTGEGIGQALLTGMLAARAIEQGGALDASSVRANYTSAVAHHLEADHKMSMLLIRALKHRKGARTAVRIAGLTDWTRCNFARWLFEDYPRSIITTPSRWHRDMFTGDGAFSKSPS
jgi:geranylgeranyl reductase family protein